MGQAGSRLAESPEPRTRRTRPLSISLSRPLSTTPEEGDPPHAAGSRRLHGSRPLSALSFGRTSRNFLEDPAPSTEAPARRRSRLQRARSNFVTSLPHLFRRHESSDTDAEAIGAARSSFSRHASASVADQHSNDRTSSTAPQVMLPTMDLNIDSISPSDSSSDPRPSPRRSSRPTSMTDRLTSFRQDRGIRNMTASLRRRSPVRPGEDQAAMLSRLLSFAAAATAASLMGGDRQAISDARSVAGEGEDGTFDSFIQALQSGRIASALRQSGNESGDGTEESPSPLNFLRMFRLGSPNDSRRRSGLRHRRHEEDGSEARMIPIIIVGIRSLTPDAHNNAANRDDSIIPSLLEALSTTMTPSTTDEADNETPIRQPRNGTAFSHRRRASMGGVNPPGSTENQRQPRPRPWSTISNSSSGPLPPPSTPASPGLSTLSSETSTPAGGMTPNTSAVQSSAPSRQASSARRTPASSLDTSDLPTPRQRRQRPMSESDFTLFGSGSSRRNGVVEPDSTPERESRSWIIYVLGGSYPENHPLLTTPSLFTDSPTYEDMLLASALLGPVKPPVANQEDVDASGGLFKVQRHGSRVVAVSLDDEQDTISVDERCLICLGDFELDEDARKLKKCSHLFHKDCIDQWLLTGRNSCPLCRGQGVEETPGDSSGSSENPVPSAST